MSGSEIGGLRLERVGLEECDSTAFAASPDRVVFQTTPWLQFLRQTQDAEPVVAVLRRDGEIAGCFTGGIVRRFGVRILGSPFPGWTTGWMGFNLSPEVDRWDATRSLVRFAFEDLRCRHLELRDRLLDGEAPSALGLTRSDVETYEVDLADDEAAIFERMSSACRRAIRKSERSGVTVERARGIEFAREYYAQLEDVFAKQSLRPTYGVERVEALIRALEPTDDLLLLRARAPDGQSIATGIFPGHGSTAHFWGGASWREHQILRPNEAIFWHAMRYWKRRGATVLEMGGGGDYKRRYGPRHVVMPSYRRSRPRVLGPLRDAAEQIKRRGY